MVNEIITFDHFTWDRRSRCLYAHGMPVPVRGAGVRLLQALLDRPGEVVTKAELLDRGWGASAVTENALHVHIAALRKAIGRHLIITESGVGYRFVGHLGVPPQAPAQAPPTPSPRYRWLPAAAASFCILLAAVAAAIEWNPAPARNTFAPPARSLAILPFANLCGSPAADYLSDGISAALINALGRVDALKVAAQTSSFSFRGRSLPVLEIGRALNVADLLEGSLRRDGETMHIDAQLIDTHTGYQIWSRSYSGDIHSILTVQDDLIASVVSSMKVTTDSRETSSLTVGGTHNPQAYDAELRAEHLMQAITPATVRQALAAFDQALRLDPGYSDAHAGRARALNAINAMWETDPQQKHSEAVEALHEAEIAVALAPNSALAHIARASELSRRLDLAGAAVEYVAAHRLNSGNATVERGYATMQAMLGHSAEAEGSMKRAIDLDPVTAWSYGKQAEILYLDRKYDAALAALRREQAIGGDDGAFVRMMSALVHLAQRKPQAVIADCAQGCIASDAWMAIAYEQVGRDAEAHQSLSRLMQSAPDDLATYCAFVFAQWGDRPAALHWLSVAAAAHSAGLQVIKVEPLLDPIRNTPEFKDIELRLNLPS